LPLDQGGLRLSIWVILLLALAWAVVLVPSLLKPKFESSPIDGVRNFERSMGILANARHGRQQIPGRWVLVPKDLQQGPKRRRALVIQRRRRNFVRLIIVFVSSLILGAIPHLHFFLWVALAGAAGLGVYVWQLRRWHGAEQNVVPLPAPPSHEPVEQPARDAGASS
jgi:Flp pilus assembly protein TadB